MDLQELRTRTAAGERFDYLLFYGHTVRGSGAGPWVFSQWYAAPFELDGEEYPTAEHWMMAEKARLFGDAEMREQILSADGPGQAKKLGRKVRGFVEETWGRERFGLVVRGNVAKFGQHEELRAYLLSTGDKVLVEASPTDRIWGIGLSADHAHAELPAHWRGKNLLGFALMEARRQLAVAEGIGSKRGDENG
jgi:ribA/ribD-fused uncharacterized protein